MKKQYIILLGLFLLPLFCLAQRKENPEDSLVEVSGVTLTADSLRGIPGVSVLVKGQNRGTVTNDQGVFSIVVFKGDTLTFRAIGFKTKQVKIPDTLTGNFYGIAQPMSQDTTYLPLTTIHPYPTKEEFENAFLHWNIPDDQYDIARANTAIEKLRASARFVPPDGGEGVSHTFQHQSRMMSSKGQFPTMNIFNPLAWAKFIKALKNGDFKRRD